MSGSGMVANGDEASANPGVTRRRDDPNSRGELVDNAEEQGYSEPRR